MGKAGVKKLTNEERLQAMLCNIGILRQLGVILRLAGPRPHATFPARTTDTPCIMSVDVVFSLSFQHRLTWNVSHGQDAPEAKHLNRRGGHVHVISPPQADSQGLDDN